MHADLRLGAYYATGAAAAFALTAACVKGAAAEADSMLVVFFRNAVSLLLLLPWLSRHGWSALQTQRMGGHLLRAAFGICAMYCFFYAIAHLHMAEALLLTYSTPMFIPFIAWLWIRERPSASVFPALLLGAAGLLLILRPNAGGLPHFPALVGLLSGVCAAAAMVSIRRISDTEPAVRIVFYFSALATAITAVPLWWIWQTPSATTLLLMVGSGLFATVGQLWLTRAYALAPAARIGAFTYTAVLYSGLLGWLFWDERPDASSLTGMALVVVCCLLAGGFIRRPAVRLIPPPSRTSRPH